MKVFLQQAPPVREPPPPAPWRWQTVLQAPHRLGFVLAMAVLAASGLWWALVQASRMGLAPPLGYALSPSLVHASVMTLGFIPLFFSGFLFTAGPKWLGVEGPDARTVQPALLAQALGWFIWLAGAHSHLLVAVAGLLLAAAGLGAVTLRFARLVIASRAPDRMHAKAIAAAHATGFGCLAGIAAALLLDAPGIARQLALSALWGFVVVVYLSVAHRMIPFFTASALPKLQAWRPQGVLVLMLATAAFEVAAVWLEPVFGMATPWLVLRGAVEFTAGAVLMALAFAWHLVKSLKIRLLAMLHLGFVWLGIALALGGLSQWMGAATGTPALPLGMLHALTMGCLGSLMVAMVTRVSCGHSGRSLVADNLVWGLFWLLQLATLARIAATLATAWSQALLFAAALLWAGIMAAWALRYGNWYGRPRADGRLG